MPGVSNDTASQVWRGNLSLRSHTLSLHHAERLNAPPPPYHTPNPPQPCPHELNEIPIEHPKEIDRFTLWKKFIGPKRRLT